MASSTQARVHAVDPYGKRVTIPQSQVADAVEQGYRVTTAQEALEAKRQEQYGGIGQKAITAAEGAVSGVTVGLSDQALVGALGEDYRREAERRADINPWTRSGAEIVGALAPMLAGGAGAATEAAAAAKLAKTASGASRAIELVGAAPRAIARAGAGAERAIASLVGESRAARVVAKAAGGALEGAAYEAGHEVSQSAIHDTPLTGESLAMAAGRGFLFGGAVGGGLGALSRGAHAPGAPVAAKESRAAALAAESGAEAHAAEQSIVSGGGGTARVEMSLPERTYGALTGQDVELSRALMNPEKRAIALADKEAHVGDLAREAKATYDTSQSAISNLQQNVLRGAAKDRQMASLVERSAIPIESAQKSADDVLSQLREGVSQLADPTKYNPKTVASMASDIKAFEGRIAKIASDAKPGQAGEIFNALDDLKATWGRKYATQPNALGAAAGGQYMGVLRPALEHESWGLAAAAQKTINEPYSRWIGYQRQARKLVEYNTGGKDPTDTFRDLFEANAANYKGIFRNAGKVESDAALQVIQDAAKASRDLAVAAREVYSLTPQQRALVESVDKATAGYQGSIDKAIEHVALIDKRIAAETAGPGSVAKAIGMVPGIGPSVAATITINPVTWARRWETIAKARSRIASIFDGSIKNYIADAGSKVKRSTGVGLGGLRVATVATSIALAQRRVDERREQLARLKSEPERKADLYAQALGELHELAPVAATSAIETWERGNAFLESKLPPEPQPLSALTPQLGNRKVAPLDALRFARYERAVDHPESVMADLSRGTLTHEAVEAIRNVYPLRYFELQKAAMFACAQRTKPLPYQDRVRLSVLLDIPGDATMAPDFRAAMAQTWASSAKANQPYPDTGKAQSPLRPGELSATINPNPTIEDRKLV